MVEEKQKLMCAKFCIRHQRAVFLTMLTVAAEMSAECGTGYNGQERGSEENHCNLKVEVNVFVVVFHRGLAIDP